MSDARRARVGVGDVEWVIYLSIQDGGHDPVHFALWMHWAAE